MKTLVECVPNFSEGRDASKVDAIVAALCSLPGITVLDREMDADHNRSVITFAGSRENVGEAALRGAARAAELIDLTHHTGAHPRIGATDVIPFVPIEGVTLDDCVAIARQVGEELWRRLKIPVYLYEAAATRPERRNLENIRRGQFEGLRQEIATNPERAPDFGEPSIHPTAGAIVVGARKFLIAYNINLNTSDVQVAKAIARSIRASSGGFPCVKAMGVELKARNLAQVSMNLTDFETTSIHTVWEAVRAEAARHGAEPIGSEIIGLVPKKALEDAAAAFLKVENFTPEMILENRLAATASGAAARPASPREMCEAFVDATAAPSPTPGGGSVSALAGALAAALGRMVAGLSLKKKAYMQYAGKLNETAGRLAQISEEMKAAIDRDSASYEAVLAAYRLPKDDPSREEAIQRALQSAADVPLSVVERAAETRGLLEQLTPLTSPQMSSDLKVGRLMADAAIEGARANVEINLESITDSAYLSASRERLEAIHG
jgi:glutamate formiminotransferase